MVVARAEILSPRGGHIAPAAPRIDTARAKARRVTRARQALLKTRPDLAADLAPAMPARAQWRARSAGFYVFKARCDLKCEGCYHFGGGPTHHLTPKSDIGALLRFFAAEAACGVSMADFFGALPALAPKLIMAGAQHLPWGDIGANGAIPIPREAPFRIGVLV
jgi:hypothetical protein